MEIQHLVLNGVGSPFQIALDDQVQFFHVVDRTSSASTPVGQGKSLHVLRVNTDGTLVEVSWSPTILVLPDCNRPQGVVAF